MSKSLNPKNLVERLEGRVPIGPEETRALLENLFDLVAEEVKTSGRMALFGFGSFSTVPVKGRIRLSPRTGEPVVIPEHLRVKFSPASALAERVNKEYEALEPVILEEAVPEGLLVKASRYREGLEEDQEEIFSSEKPASGTPVKVSPEVIPKPAFVPSSVKDPVKKNGRRRVIFAMIILGTLIVLFGLILLLSPAEKKPSAAEEQMPPSVPAKERPERMREATADSTMTYNITPGDTFSRLAQQYWGNVDLWPYLWNANSCRFPDPDFLRPGDRVMIPDRPDEHRQREEIETSILSAYIRYHTLMEQQENHPRNRYRILNVRNLISGGQELYPDFIQRYRHTIQPEDLPLQ